ncbi:MULTISPECIES: hypothetical protein [unclassified Sphingomonas]|uniref:hypothetical protein n=1 Tax=unclassified Sphingomonas TaxID=196159 RepID=UPI00082D5E23|nr:MULTISPECIES: hypothetical protein [unclassified Sphingomonas]
MILLKREREAIAMTKSSAKQKLADFFQNRLAILDRTALVCLSIVPIMIALISGFIAGGRLSPGEVEQTIFITAVASVATFMFFSLNYAGQAIRLRDAYHAEWSRLFAGARPYPLVSYLLNVPGAEKIGKRQPQ